MNYRLLIGLLAALALAVMSGCASTSADRIGADGSSVTAGPGAGGYTLDSFKTTTTTTDANTGNQTVVEEKRCHVDATSARDLTDAGVSVSEDCALDATVAKTNGVVEQTQTMLEMFRSGQQAVTGLIPLLLGQPLSGGAAAPVTAPAATGQPIPITPPQPVQ